MNVARINPFVRQLHAPEPMQGVPAWLIWRYQEAPGEDKPRKVPYWHSGQVRHGRQGGPADRDHLTTFAIACDAAAARGFDGVGFAPLPGNGYTFVDFDNCVGADGAVNSEVLALIRGTYAEYSPSGRGVRAVFEGDLGNRKSPTKDGQFGFEVFSSSGFVTITGNMLPAVDVVGLHDTILRVPEHLRAYCESRFGARAPGHDPEDFMAGYEPRLGLTVARIEGLLEALDPDMGRQEWINVGMALHHECEGDDTGFDMWNGWSSRGSKYASEEDLRVQWDSFTRRAGPGRRQVTMRTVIWMVKNASPAPALADAEHIREVLAQESRPVAVCETPPDFGGPFPIVRASEAESRPAPDWFIKRALPQGDVGIVFGASGSGKSFVVFDVACALARGLDWRGLRTRKSRVLIIAAEGGGGVAARIKAYCRQHGISSSDLDLGVMYAAPNFMDGENISDVCRSIQAAGGFDIIFVDTFAQVTPGANENTSEDMGRALANVRTLRDVSGAMIVLVHHAGKDASRGSRGWSGLKAAADFQWEVLRHEDGGREIHLEKVKDGEDGLRWGFKLEPVVLDMDSDGDEVTSCVVVETELRAALPADDSRRLKRRSRIATHILEVVETLGPEVHSIPMDRFVAIAADMLPVPEGVRDTRRQQIVRTLRDLAREKEGPLVIERDLLIFCE